MFNIVLVHPVIPQNTGNIGRLAGATNTLLHLIEPLGFEITDAKVKRAGLDYWPEIKLIIHKSWEHFLAATNAQPEQIYLLTKKAEQFYFSAKFKAGDFLVFGAETTGLPPELHERYPQQRYRIPMNNPNVRSLNLSNSVSIVLYEAKRQVEFNL
ncbi:MAG: tRNA (cytidine(34)-2'-O)-methyltransferase [Deltaproteobacteria bacterium]|jgi:tRNA (cytidine/uridine-2'-O-)-methyltransferase|nr:tRNA (cytidine(34)-2'-O)-methyltransferase [Deltaproteobacteria bacterium]